MPTQSVARTPAADKLAIGVESYGSRLMFVVSRTHTRTEWLIRYPSGAELRKHGELVIVYIKDACSPAIDADSDAVFILDPRAVITDAETGQLYYGPSSLPSKLLDPGMAKWIEEHPEWERDAAGGPAPRLPLAIPKSETYIAPRVGTRPAQGRVREAACGHDVLLSERGVEAVDLRGKRLVCGPCMEALAAEEGARLGVTEEPI